MQSICIDLMHLLSSLYVCICALVCFFSCKTYCSVIQKIKHESNYFGPCLIINIQVSKMYFLKVFFPFIKWNCNGRHLGGERKKVPCIICSDGHISNCLAPKGILVCAVCYPLEPHPCTVMQGMIRYSATHE